MRISSIKLAKRIFERRVDNDERCDSKNEVIVFVVIGSQFVVTAPKQGPQAAYFDGNIFKNKILKQPVKQQLRTIDTKFNLHCMDRGESHQESFHLWRLSAMRRTCFHRFPLRFRKS